MDKSHFFVFIFVILSFISIEQCSCWLSLYEQYVMYIIHSTGGYYRTVNKCKAVGASFGRQIGNVELIGCIIPIEPPDACSPIKPPLVTPVKCSNVFGLAIRGNCSFALKVLNGQKSNFDSMIIYNDENEPWVEEMQDDEEHTGHNVVIPSFLISHQCAEDLISQYSYINGYIVSIRAYFTQYDIIRYLIPFIAVIGFCFFAMLISMFFQVLKILRDRRRRSRRRISTKFLKKIPTKKYHKNDTPETCPICLDDFIEGEKLRLLPCKHWFHTNCIDPWLTKSRKVCPVCKRRVDQINSYDLDSDEENYAASERQPLIPITRNDNEQGPSNPNYSTINTHNDSRQNTMTDINRQTYDIRQPFYNEI